VATVIDGNAIAERLRQSIADELQVLRLSEVRPGLATVLIGESYDATAYEKHVRRIAEGLEYRYVCERLPDDVELDDVVATLGKLNADPRITGILVLHPLPPQIPEAELNSAVDPLKDIEAVHPLNTGLLAQGRPRFLPSTPASCFYLLDAYADTTPGGHEGFYTGKTLVVVGRSNSVGKPAQMLGLQRNATVIQCHSRTKPLEDYTRQADILIVAAGVRGIVTGDMVKEGVVAVDVGIHAIKDPDGRRPGLRRRGGCGRGDHAGARRRRPDHGRVARRQRADGGRDRPPGRASVRPVPLSRSGRRR
jgi:methylenetetrahydrofolate dehydrogenase (NADP+)/methenyltetrahydrofolate cyclohydrolase